MGAFDKCSESNQRYSQRHYTPCLKSSMNRVDRRKSTADWLQQHEAALCCAKAVPPAGG